MVHIQTSSRRYYRCVAVLSSVSFRIRYIYIYMYMDPTSRRGKLSFRDAEVTWSRHKSVGDRAKKYPRLREIGVLDYLTAQSSSDKMCFIFGTGLKRAYKCFYVASFARFVLFTYTRNYPFSNREIIHAVVGPTSFSFRCLSLKNYFTEYQIK